MKREYFDGISIIICCYNSAWIIRRTLQALFRQEVPAGVRYEILLVDNNCSDETVAIANEMAIANARTIEIVKESSPGLVNARRAGVVNAKYKYLLFCDDDNLLSDNYISTVYKIFNSDSRIGAIGGCGVAEFGADPDPRILDKLGAYAIGSQVSHSDWLFGAGMAVRTEIAYEIYTEQKLFLVGRMGDMLLSGDDTELSLSVRLRGFLLHPTDEISFTHVLKASRLSYDYYVNLSRGMANSRAPIKVMRYALEGYSFLTFCMSYVWKRMFPTRKNRKAIADILLWGLPKLREIHCEFSRILRKRSNPYPRVLVVAHIYYPEFWNDIYNAIKNIGKCDVVITYTSDNAVQECRLQLPSARLMKCDNVGFDVWPFIKTIQDTNLSDYDYIVKLHTKRDYFPPSKVRIGGALVNGSGFRKLLLNFVSSKHNWRKCLWLLQNHLADIVTDARLLSGRSKIDKESQKSFDRAIEEAGRLGLSLPPAEKLLFSVGTMFVARAELLEPIKNANYTARQFEASGHLGFEKEVDGMAHMFERLFSFLAQTPGRSIVGFNWPTAASIKECKILGYKRVKSDGRRIYFFCGIPIFSRRSWRF